TRFSRDWSSDVCSSDLPHSGPAAMNCSVIWATAIKFASLGHMRHVHPGLSPMPIVFQLVWRGLRALQESAGLKKCNECESGFDFAQPPGYYRSLSVCIERSRNVVGGKRPGFDFSHQAIPMRLRSKCSLR